MSVVIPTRGRAGLVTRAVRSALAQDPPVREVIVVLDGPDAETESSLAAIQDPRVRGLALPRVGGMGTALNRGIGVATGSWVAVLDDDDEWLAGKLEAQLASASRASRPLPIVSCRFIRRTQWGDMVWPRCEPGPSEGVADYLLAPRDLRGGRGMLLNSTLLAPRELFVRCPYPERVGRHVDAEWAIVAVQDHGATVHFPESRQPFVIYNDQAARPRVTTAAEWKPSLEWGRAVRERLGGRAYAGFLLTWASVYAARARDLGGLVALTAEAFRNGSPTWPQLVAHASIWLVPSAARARVNVWIEQAGQRQ